MSILDDTSAAVTAPAIENITSPSPRPADQGTLIIICTHIYVLNYYINYVTDNPLTKPPRAHDLLTQVASKARAKLEVVGLALGDQLNTISKKHKNVILCYSEVFTAWEKTVTSADFTWATVVEALESPIVKREQVS